MNIIKSFSRRSLAWILFFMLIFILICNLAVYRAWLAVIRALPPELLKAAAEDSAELKAGLEALFPLVVFLKTWFTPISAGVFLILGLILWFFLRRSLVRLLRKEGEVPAKAGEKANEEKKPRAAEKKPGKEKAARTEETAAAAPSREEQQEEKKARLQMNQRYYLHLLSVLQREGRLIDFFEEDLNQYEDAQIGAAVRSIQDVCKQTINKTLSPKPVFEKAEGETVTIPADFDAATVKLTGNVSGDPPFTGILRHRGWRAGKLELPTLSGSPDPRIIAPAEVEVG
ncbi:MAG: DUF2760 domain-containing protein [Thermodesulfobacteriota bacterium]